MNRDEQIVFNFLESKFQKVVYEPDGNVPPDFLVDDTIALEVRRFNQNIILKNGNLKSLEKERFPLRDKIVNLLNKQNSNQFNTSWYVGVRFKRPIENWESLSKKIVNILDIVKHNIPPKYSEFYINENFVIKFSPLEKKDKLFHLAIFTDSDESGFVLPKIEHNLKLIIDEKTEKIKKHKHIYNEWWLVLIDYIGYGLRDFERVEINQNKKIKHEWDKVILLNPLNIESYYEI